MVLTTCVVATVYPSIYAKLAYDPRCRPCPVSVVAEVVLALAVGPAIPADVKTLPAFIERMRANPQLANAGSPGLGTLPHLVKAMFFRQAGVTWTHVPYAGGPEAISDLYDRLVRPVPPCLGKNGGG